MMNANLSKHTSSSRFFTSVIICSLLGLTSIAEAKPAHKKPVNKATHSASKLSIADYIHTTYKRPTTQAQSIQRTVLAKANELSLDPLLLMAIIQKESSFRPSASSGGNSGLMQIDVSAHRKRIHGNVFDIPTNIEVGTSIFKECLEEENGNVEATLSLYNRGCSRSRRAAKIKEGKPYMKAVLKHLDRIKSKVVL